MLRGSTLRILIVLLCVGYVLAIPGETALAGDPPLIPGTTWNTVGLLKAKGGGDKVKELTFAEIKFGPLVGSTGTFEIEYTDGRNEFDVRGTYTIFKGKIKSMTVDLKHLSSELDSLLRRYGPRLISIDKVKLKAKAKSSKKKGTSIKCDLKMKVIASESGWVGKISIQFKVAGTPKVLNFADAR